LDLSVAVFGNSDRNSIHRGRLYQPDLATEKIQRFRLRAM